MQISFEKLCKYIHHYQKQLGYVWMMKDIALSWTRKKPAKLLKYILMRKTKLVLPSSVRMFVRRINSSPPSAAYMHLWVGSALFQIMACHLFSWILRSKLQWNFNQNTKFFIHEMHPKISSAKGQPSCPGGDEIMVTNNTIRDIDLLCHGLCKIISPIIHYSIIGNTWILVTWVLLNHDK